MNVVLEENGGEIAFDETYELAPDEDVRIDDAVERKDYTAQLTIDGNQSRGTAEELRPTECKNPTYRFEIVDVDAVNFRMECPG